jgi:hypothetical protein
MNQVHPTLYYIAGKKEGEVEAMTLREVRSRLQDGLIPDTQLMWNPAEKMWVPIQMISWLKRTTVLEMPFTLKEVRKRTDSIAKPAVVEPQAQKVKAIPIVYPKAIATKTKPIYIYPPKRTPGEQMIFLARHRRSQEILLGVFISACLWSILWSFNVLTVQARLSRALIQAGNQVKLSARYAYFVDSRDLVIDLRKTSLTSDVSKLTEILTTLSTGIPERPLSKKLFNTIEVLVSSKQVVKIDGATWKELSIFKDLPLDQRIQMLSKFSNSLQKKSVNLTSL